MTSACFMRSSRSLCCCCCCRRMHSWSCTPHCGARSHTRTQQYKTEDIWHNTRCRCVCMTQMPSTHSNTDICGTTQTCGTPQVTGWSATHDTWHVFAWPPQQVLGRLLPRWGGCETTKHWGPRLGSQSGTLAGLRVEASASLVHQKLTPMPRDQASGPEAGFQSGIQAGLQVEASGARGRPPGWAPAAPWAWMGAAWPPPSATAAPGRTPATAR